MKKIFMLIVVVLFMFSAGCSGGGSSETTDTTVPLSSGKAITAFSFETPFATGVISEETHTIDITVPSGTNVNSLITTFTTTGVSVRVDGTDQVSGETANDFNYPVVYTVTASDATTQDYIVTVAEAAPSYIGSYSGSWSAGILLSGGVRFTINDYTETSISGTIEDLKFGYGIIPISTGYISGNNIHAEGSVGSLNVAGDGTFSSDGLTLYGNFTCNSIRGTFAGTKE